MNSGVPNAKKSAVAPGRCPECNAIGELIDSLGPIPVAIEGFWKRAFINVFRCSLCQQLWAEVNSFQ